MPKSRGNTRRADWCEPHHQCQKFFEFKRSISKQKILAWTNWSRKQRKLRLEYCWDGLARRKLVFFKSIKVYFTDFLIPYFLLIVCLSNRGFQKYNFQSLLKKSIRPFQVCISKLWISWLKHYRNKGFYT